jgi:hypothetical protein
MNFFLIGFILLIIGVTVFFPARTARKTNQRRSGWPRISGKITSGAEVIVGDPLATETGQKVLYDIKVRYEFRTGGQLRFGSAVSYPRVMWSKTEADRLAAQYPKGCTVAVRFNPEDPQDCYLAINSDPIARYYGISLAATIVGAVILGISLLSSVLGG